MDRLPHVKFTNLYGPTEATIASSYHTLERRPADENSEVPIGTACGGEELLVLDDARQPVPPGGIGNLHIGGAGLSPGYWRDPARTAEAYAELERPGGGTARFYRTGDLARLGEDGLVRFVGRADTQIKSRGYRIELGEIEAALHSIDWIEDGAVVGVATDGFEGTAICCAYVTRGGKAAEVSALRASLGNFVPGYMIPARWIQLEELPLSANGKVDRKKLQDLFMNEPPPPKHASATPSLRGDAPDV
jgi:acyl-coenzyme A synthetase/AMP-(fatty) acid ligase